MATTWNVDPTHTDIGFKIKHLMVSNVSGTFSKFEGKVETEGEDFSTAKAEFSADIDSISTNNADRDGHLKSGDFFDMEKYPTISFKSTGFKKVDEENYKIDGDLTIRDVTKPVTLDAEFGGMAKDPWGNEKAGFTISGKVNRQDFGLVWNAPLETGGFLLSNDVKLNVELQLVKAQ
jgi:polyisoprenoid-binding protein YceI